MSALFAEAVDRMVRAFEVRARQLYGAPASGGRRPREEACRGQETEMLQNELAISYNHPISLNN